MDPAPELSFHFKAAGKSGKGMLTARLGEQAIYTDRLDLASKEDRRRFLCDLCRGAGASTAMTRR